MKKIRLGVILVSRGFAKDNAEAFVVVTEGRIFVDGQKAVSPAQLVTYKANVEMRGHHQYVGRGAYKLEAALKQFEVDAYGKICADMGAAIGGFTQVLLLHGAKRVYAIDTARGKLALKIRNDPRVVVMEETDVRDLEKLPEAIDLIVVDVSLISLRDILSCIVAGRFLGEHGEIITLFKPQYEARDPHLLSRGVIRNSVVREKLLSDFIRWVAGNGWHIKGTMVSPIRGSGGNAEYLLYLIRSR